MSVNENWKAIWGEANQGEKKGDMKSVTGLYIGSS